MKSIDTNLLYYATNRDCQEHEKARALLEQVARETGEWILADQVLFEYYRLVRNPLVLAHPLPAQEASLRLRFFREELGCLHCAYDRDCWEQAVAALAAPAFPPARTFDLVLAVTLRRNGVDAFYTRNVRDFEGFGWFTVIDPLA